MAYYEDIPNADALALAARLALKDKDGARACAARALELADDQGETRALSAVPEQWLPPSRRPRRQVLLDATDGEAEGSTSLDAPAADLLSDREALDLVTRAASRQLDGEPAVLALQRAYETQREFGHAPSIRAVARAAGVRDLDGLAQDIDTLNRRDEAVRQLDNAQTNSASRDAQGRVMLAANADVTALLSDPAERDRRWRRAKAFDRSYESRERFEADDRLHLEGGADLLSTLEARHSPRQTATAAARMLDTALAKADTPAERSRALEAAIGRLPGHPQLAAGRSRVSAPSSGLRTLEQRGRSDTEAAQDLARLNVRQLDAVLSDWLHGPLSLDAAIAHAREQFPDGELRRHTAEPPSDLRMELHRQVVAYQLAHPELDYSGALEALAR